MPKKSKNSFSVHGDTIYINGEDWNSLGMATYREDYYDELTTHTWRRDDKGYLTNQSLGGGLHRYMMKKWYGEDVLKDMTDKGFVVDHMNNEHPDCRISNLEFLIGDKNTAKGQWVDKYGKIMRGKIALHMFKDFSTGLYQITIGFNDNVYIMNRNGESRLLNSIKFLYDCDYPLVVTDAQAILEEYASQGRINLQYLRYCDIKVTVAPHLELTEEEKKKTVIQRDGKVYLLLKKGKCEIDQVAYEKGWKPRK